MKHYYLIKRRSFGYTIFKILSIFVQIITKIDFSKFLVNDMLLIYSSKSEEGENAMLKNVY